MPNDEKTTSSSTGGIRQRDPLAVIFILLFLAVIAGEIARRLNQYLSGDFGDTFLSGTLEYLAGWVPALQILSFFLSMFLIAFILYFNKQVAGIRRKEAEELYPSGKEPVLDVIPGIHKTLPSDYELNPRWAKVAEMVESDDESSWRQAIIEADIMLGEMLDHMGYQGESIGDRLKQIKKSDFGVLDLAWEAHKARNAIAHEGSEYRMTKREAQRIMDLYRQVFEAFNYI